MFCCALTCAASCPWVPVLSHFSSWKLGVKESFAGGINKQCCQHRECQVKAAPCQAGGLPQHLQGWWDLKGIYHPLEEGEGPCGLDLKVAQGVV